MSNKTKVHECAYYEYEYDDLGKYSWCHSEKMKCRECKFNYIYAQIVCPGYEKGKLRGEWEISESEKSEAEEFLHKLAKKQKEVEEAERSLYKKVNKSCTYKQ